MAVRKASPTPSLGELRLKRVKFDSETCAENKILQSCTIHSHNESFKELVIYTRAEGWTLGEREAFRADLRALLFSKPLIGSPLAELHKCFH